MGAKETLIEELNLPSSVKDYCDKAGIKTVWELGELPLSVAHKICGSKSVLLELLKEMDATLNS